MTILYSEPTSTPAPVATTTAPAAPAITESAAVPTTPAPAAAVAAAPAPDNEFGSGLLISKEEATEMVANLCEMGFPRDQVILALKASFFNPHRAVEYLFSVHTQLFQNKSHINPRAIFQLLPLLQSSRQFLKPPLLPLLLLRLLVPLLALPRMLSRILLISFVRTPNSSKSCAVFLKVLTRPDLALSDKWPEKIPPTWRHS